MPIDNILLPRNDMVTSDGRINKDAIQANITHLQNTLSTIKGVRLAPPPITNVEIPDVTLNDAGDRIINARSFVNIMKCAYYPFNMRFRNGIMLTCEWFDSDGNNHSVNNLNLNPSFSGDSNILYIDHNSNRILVGDENINTNDKTIIGVWRADIGEWNGINGGLSSSLTSGGEIYIKPKNYHNIIVGSTNEINQPPYRQLGINGVALGKYILVDSMRDSTNLCGYATGAWIGGEVVKRYIDSNGYYIGRGE